MKRLRIILYIFSSILNLKPVAAQQAETQSSNIINYRLQDGLPHNNISFVFQDYKGFVLVGTYNGLSKYDGYSFKNYYASTSVKDGSINHFKNYFQLNDSVYWLSSHLEGIMELNVNSNSIRLLSRIPKIPTKIFTDKQGVIWIGSMTEGFYSYKPEFKKFVQHKLVPLKNEFRYDWENNTVSEIVGDPHNDSILWLGCRSGLKSYNKLTEKIIEYNLNHTEPMHHFGLNDIHCLYLDTKNQLWVGRFFGGLGKFDLKTKAWENYFYNPDDFKQKVVSDNIISKISSYKNGVLYLATSAGPAEFNTDTKEFKKYSLLTNGTAVGAGTTTFYTDKFGNKWFGHVDQKGLSMQAAKFNSIQKIEFPKQKFAPDFYGSVATDIIYSKRYNKYFVTNTNHDGLLEYSSYFKLLKQTTLPANWKDKEPFIVKLAEDDEGILWIVDINDNLIQYEPSNGLAKNFKHPLFNSCYTVFTDKKGIVYFGTDKGIYKYYKKNWSLCLEVSDQVIISNIKNDKLFFIEERNIKLIDLQTSKISFITQLPEFSTKNYNYIQSLYCDSKNQLWIPLEMGGVYIYKLNTSKLSFLSGSQGLVSNTAREVIEDMDGRIFILCHGGLFYYNETQQRFIDFDNLISKKTNDWYEHFISVTENNQLLLSKDNSIFLINQSLALHFEKSNPIITAINGKGFSFNNFKGTVIIPNNENSLKVSFSNFDFAAVNEIIYEYKLDKYKDWIQLEKGKNSLDLQNLSEGNHVLKLRIAGSNHVTLLKFRIKAIWYKSQVFYAVLILFFALALMFGLWYWQHRKYKEQLLQKKVTEYKLKALQSQLNPHFLFNCLNSINALIKIGEYERAESTLQGFAKLMRAILTVSGEQLISLKQELELAVLYLDIEKVRKDDAFSSKIISNIKDETSVKVPPLLLQPFLENCIKHGFRKTSKEQKPEITIAINQVSNEIEIEVLDNGCGMDLEKKSNHTSMGIEIQRDRLRQYALTNNMNIALTTGDNSPNGFRVLIKIRYLLNNLYFSYGF